VTWEAIRIYKKDGKDLPFEPDSKTINGPSVTVIKYQGLRTHHPILKMNQMESADPPSDEESPSSIRGRILFSGIRMIIPVVAYCESFRFADGKGYPEATISYVPPE
jgi:hypothetical protein